MPLPGDDSHIPGVERGLEQILLVGVVVDVSLEKLQINVKVVVKAKMLLIEQRLYKAGSVQLSVQFSNEKQSC